MAVTPLALYGTRTQSSIIPTANTLSQAVGGSAASSNTIIGMHFGYGEVQSQGTSATWPELVSPSMPSGLGWIKDTPLLDSTRIILGTWSASLQMNVSADGTTLTTDMLLRFYRRSQASVYTAIGTLTLLAQTVTGTLTTYTFPSSNLNAVSFGTGDRLYLDLYLNVTGNTSTSPATVLTTTMGVASLGVDGSLQFVTPGYTQNPKDDISMRLNLSNQLSTKDMLSRIKVQATGVRDMASRLLFGTTYSLAVMADNPYSYYRLGETSGTVAHDETANANNGTISGGVTLGQAGALAGDSNGSMLFNGTSGLVTLPTRVRPETWAAFSVECWFNLANTTFTDYPALVGNEWAYGHSLGFELLINSGGSSLEWDIGNGITHHGVVSGALSAGIWYHFVGTYDGSTLLGYLNGDLFDTKSLTGPMAASSYAVTIANANSLGTGVYFHGTIDEVALYPATLSAARVLAHYNAAGRRMLNLSTRLLLS